MKKIISFLIVLILLTACKQDIVKAPIHLIEKEEMINIMYDLSILEAIKNQNPTSLETYKINPNEYIYKKYKIDSVQFAQNNKYYAADYKTYKVIYDEIKARLDKNKKTTEVLIKVENKKNRLKKAAAEKLKAKKASDSIKKSHPKLLKKLNPIKKSKLMQLKFADSIKKIKERKLN